MYTITRTNSDDIDFHNLVIELDKDLAIRDGDDYAFFALFNKTGTIKYVVLVYENETPVGCGALRVYADKILEVKRMFVPAMSRGKGIASLVLKELENWAKELNYQRLILETGVNQPEAISLYKKNNYAITPNYGQYAEVKSSVCFEKYLV